MQTLAPTRAAEGSLNRAQGHGATVTVSMFVQANSHHRSSERSTDVKHMFALVAGVTAMVASTADAQQPNVAGRRFSPEQIRSVAPALEKHTQERLYGAVWNRPGVNHRDRSLITMAALIARGQAPALGYYADQAMENGVTPREISDRKSTRLNSSHANISYAVFCLKKKKKTSIV